jgi:hypothetical protein
MIGVDLYALALGRLFRPTKRQRSVPSLHPAIHGNQLQQGGGEASQRYPEPELDRNSHHVMYRSRIRVLVAVGLVAASSPAAAAQDRGRVVADLRQCDVALRNAADANGVPVRLLLALGPIESGVGSGTGRIYPWPWTLNINGRGSYHFRSRAVAKRYLDALIAAGVDDVDIGCLQVNWHWHRLAFASPEAALTPALNAQYAASLLRKFHAQTGTWSGAVGLYHSHDPRLAEVYRCRVARALAPTTKIRDCADARRRRS